MGQILNKQKQKQGDNTTKSIDFKSKLDIVQDLKKLDSSTNLIDVFPKYEKVYKYLEKKNHRVYSEIFILAETIDPNIQIAVQESFFQNQFEFEVEVEKLKDMESLTQQHQNMIQLLKYFEYTHQSMCTSYHRLIKVTEYISRDLSTELFFRKLLIEKSTPNPTPKNSDNSPNINSNDIQVSSFSKGQRSLSANSIALQQQSQIKNNSSLLQSKKVSDQQRKSVLFVTKVFSNDQNEVKEECESQIETPKEDLIERQIQKRSNFQFQASDNAYRFQEKEFVYIMKSLISALCYLQMQNKSHQCLRSSSIFIARDGTIKLTDPNLFNQSSLYTYIYKGQSVSGAYLSPLLIANVEYSVVKPEHNIYKSDVFSLAVILLEIAYLTKLDNYFDYTEYCAVDIQGLQILADNLKDIYSQSTISLIKSMLDESEDIRPDFVSLAQKLGIFNASTNAVVQLSKNESSSLIYSKLASSTSSNQKPIPQATSIIIQPSDYYSSRSESPRFSKNQEASDQQSVQQASRITSIVENNKKQSHVTHIINPYNQDTVRKSRDYVITDKNSKKQGIQTPTRSTTPTRIQAVSPVPHIPLLSQSPSSNSNSTFNSSQVKQPDPVNNFLMLSTPKKPELPASIDTNYRFMTPLPQVRLQTPENTTIQRHIHLLNQTPQNNNKQTFFLNKETPIKTESTATDIKRTLNTESTVEIQRYKTRSTSPIIHHQSSPSKQPITPKTQPKTTIITSYTPTQTRLSINQYNAQLTPPSYASTQQQNNISPISKILPTYQTEQSTTQQEKPGTISPITNYSTQQPLANKDTLRSISPIGNGAYTRQSITTTNGGLMQSSSQNKLTPFVSSITPKQESQPNLTRNSVSAANILTVGNNNKNPNVNMTANVNNPISSRSPSPITSKSTKQIRQMISQTDEKPSANVQIQQHIQYKQLLQQQQQQQQQQIPQTSTKQTDITRSSISNPQPALTRLSITNLQSVLPKQQTQNPTNPITRQSITSLSQQTQQQQKPPSLKSSQQQNRQSTQHLQIHTPTSQISPNINVQSFISSQSAANRYNYSNQQPINYTSMNSNTNNISALNKLTANALSGQKKPLNAEPITHKKSSNPKIPSNIKSQKHGSLLVNEQQLLGQQSMQSSSINNTQTDSMTDSSQQLKSSSRQLQKSHRYSQSGNQFQYRSKTEVGGEQDQITPEYQKQYDNFFNNAISKSPSPFLNQGNQQLFNFQQQSSESSYKPYIPRMSMNAINNMQSKDTANTAHTQDYQNNQKQIEPQKQDSKNSSIIDGLGDLKPASEMFKNKKFKQSIDLQPQQYVQTNQNQQKSLKSSTSSSKSLASVKQSQKKLSQNASKQEIQNNNNNGNNGGGKKELTMSQIDRELEKHRNFQKKLQEDMDRQKQQQVILQQQLTTPSQKIQPIDDKGYVSKLDKQTSLNTLIDQHILDNQLRSTPSDIIQPFAPQNQYINTYTEQEQPLKTYNYTGTFGQQQSPISQNIQEIKIDQPSEEEEEIPKKSSPPKPKEFGTDYIDQLIAKFKSEITNEINTNNQTPTTTTAATPTYNTNTISNTINNGLPNIRNYNPPSIPNGTNQSNINGNIILNEKITNEPSSSERIMKRVESSSIGIGGYSVGGATPSYSSKLPASLGNKNSQLNNNEDRVFSDYTNVVSRGDILNNTKSPNSIIKQNFTEINSIPLSLYQKADALSGLDLQELKGQFNEQLKSMNIDKQQQGSLYSDIQNQQQQSSISTTPQQISQILNQDTHLIYERLGSRDNTNSISQNTSVSNNSHSIQIILPKQGNLVGNKQSKRNSLSNKNVAGMNSQEEINIMNNFLVQNEEDIAQHQFIQDIPQADQNNIQMQIARQQTFGANAPAIKEAIKKAEEQNQQFLSAQFNNSNNNQNVINFPFTSFAQSSQQSNYNNNEYANNYDESNDNQILNNNDIYLNYNDQRSENYTEQTSELMNNFNQNQPTYDKKEILNINSNSIDQYHQNEVINNDYCNLQREPANDFRTPNSKHISQQLLTPASDSVFNEFIEGGQNNHQLGSNNFVQNFAQNGMNSKINMHQEQQYQYPSIPQSKKLNQRVDEIQTPNNINQYRNIPYSGGSSSVYQLTVTPPHESIPSPPVKVQQYDQYNNSQSEEENIEIFTNDQQIHQQHQQYCNQMMDGCSNISHIQQVIEDDTYNSKRSFDASDGGFLLMRINQELTEEGGICTSNFNQTPNMIENNKFLQSPKKGDNISSNRNPNVNQYNLQQSDRYHTPNTGSQQQQNPNNNYSANKNILFTPSPTKKDDSMQFNQTFSELQMIQFLKNKENVIETYEDGSYYEGEKMNAVRHGRGKFFYGDGGSFQGEWQNGHMNGYGVLYYPSQNKAYEGEWDDDKFNGKGIMYNERPAEFQGTFNYHNMNEINDFWIKYEGDFKDDFKNGVGTLYLTNGERYIGRFKNDMVHGRGTFYKIDGSFITAEWSQNILLNYQ